ncbi:response regulator [Oceanospirillum sediminis]|uniref:histidine kinase n=1 Tax=Oceanospirillum sediminis TaxID=2760088 RepID=A0A839IW11_9GAMM|nr:response regulator [Oceanospirillum sediminis]MBB1488814.1 response regulator [Oceanospirillum sediminis]
MREFLYSTPMRFGIYSLLISLIGMMAIAFLTYDSSAKLLETQALARLSDDLQREESLFMEQVRTLKDDIRLLSNNASVSGIVRARQGNGYDEQENMTLAMWQQRLSSMTGTVMQQRSTYQIVQLRALSDNSLLLNMERQDNVVLTLPTSASTAESLNEAYERAKISLINQIDISNPVLLKKDQRVAFPPQSAIFASRLIRDNQGQPYAILVIQVNFDLMASNLKASKDDISYFVANEAGQYIAHSDPYRNWGAELNPQYTIAKDFPLLDDISYRQNSYFEKKSIETLTDDSGLVIRHIPLRSEGFTEGLLIGAKANLTHIHQQSQDLFRNIMLLMAIGVLIIGLVTTAAAYHLTRPLLRLKKAADEITAGNNQTTIPIEGKDEISSLGRSIKAMLEHLDLSRQELAEINASLEQKVTDRTIELEIALDQANAAAIAKAQFLATMSHEIRTPLNGVLGMTELLLNTPLNSLQQRHLETVKRSGETLLNLLNDILDLSKIEAGKLTINHSEFNPNELIENCVMLFADTAGKKGLEVIPATLPNMQYMLIGDPDRINQVLMNLVNNAIKFTEQGQVVVSIEILDERDKQFLLRFKVEDTGIGISEEAQQRLFQKFVQLDNSSTRKYGGTGLGLAISRQLTELMGGHISMHSQEGYGTSIWFDLPLDKGRRSISLTAEHQTLLSQTSALIIDDNSTNRELLHHIMESWGIQNDSSDNAHSAFTQLTQQAESGNTYDLILLDQMMPDMTGLELARKIRQHPLMQNLHIVMLSSMEIGSEQEWQQSGVDFYLRKPFRQSELYNALISVLSGQKNQILPAQSGTNDNPIFNLTEKQGCRILLVEDTPVNQQVSLGMLSQTGITADLAENGSEALTLYQKKEYDLILMDIQMPVMDGYEATAHIRASEQNSKHHTPIIALTAHAMNGDKELCIRRGMDDHLAKPLTRRALLEMLAKWLPNRTQEKSVYRSEKNGRTEPAALPPGEDREQNESIVLDKNVLQKLSEDLGGQSLQPVLNTFLSGLPELESNIISAFKIKDYDKMKKSAHRLKGSARSLGACQAGDLAEQIEQHARSEDYSELKATTEQLGPAIKALEEALQDLNIEASCNE